MRPSNGIHSGGRCSTDGKVMVVFKSVDLGGDGGESVVVVTVTHGVWDEQTDHGCCVDSAAVEL